MGSKLPPPCSPLGLKFLKGCDWIYTSIYIIKHHLKINGIIRLYVLFNLKEIKISDYTVWNEILAARFLKGKFNC